MLVVTRRPNEFVVLCDENGNEVRVTVLKTRRGETRLGFTAPQSVRIVRGEIDRPRNEEKVIA